MKKRLLCKCLITLGLLLSFLLLTPLASYNVAMAQANGTDKEKPVDYRLNLKSVTIVKGKTFTLKAYNISETTKISFKSDDVEIASVSEDGTITANKVGTTIITVTFKDGTNNPPSLTCNITVGPPAFSIKLTRSRIILGIENSDTVKVILKPSNSAEDARFSSYDPNIVSISTGGRATAKKLGMTYLFAEIDATNNDGTSKFAVCSAIVVNSEDVPLLETYFNEHSELYYISEADLIKTLDDFFNGKSNGNSTSTKKEEVSKSTLVNNLNRYLEDKFDLTGLRAKAAALLNAASNIK